MNSWVYKTMVGGGLAIIGFFLVATYNRLLCIESELMMVRINLAQIRIVTTEDIREIALSEILKYHAAGTP